MENTQKYEVLRMIERDGRCHISLDNVEGTLLIYRVQRESSVDKHLLLDWFRQLVIQLELFYQSGGNGQYRYLNPYSILVTSDERIMLLDLEAESNDFVIRNMQMRSMRNHFMKPLIRMREESKIEADLFSLGKTFQFILACTEVQPSFTLIEEYRLSKMIQKCIEGDSRTRYSNLQQILKDIPKDKVKKQPMFVSNKKTAIVVCLFVVIIVITLLVFLMRDTPADAPENIEENIVTEQMVEEVNGTVEDESIIGDKLILEEEPMDDMELIRQAFEENTKDGNEIVISEGEALKGELLYYLAMAYDREGQVDLAISAYTLLCESQCDTAVLEEAFYRKAVLERERSELELAKATCEKGLEALPESELLKGLLDEIVGEYEHLKTQEENMGTE